jgi:hypothetical protein
MWQRRVVSTASELNREIRRIWADRRRWRDSDGGLEEEGMIGSMLSNGRSFWFAISHEANELPRAKAITGTENIERLRCIPEELREEVRAVRERKMKDCGLQINGE